MGRALRVGEYEGNEQCGYSGPSAPRQRAVAAECGKLAEPGDCKSIELSNQQQQAGRHSLIVATFAILLSLGMVMFTLGVYSIA